MRLKVLLPTQVLVDEEVQKIIAEAENGSFCLLPRHIDFVSALTPGILTFVLMSGEERFVAMSGGTLVKCRSEVLVSAQDAILGTHLGELQEAMEARFQSTEEQERSVRSAVANLEAGMVRHFIELRKHGTAA